MRSHPKHVGLVVPVASFLMHDSNTNVKKVRSVAFYIVGCTVVVLLLEIASAFSCLHAGCRGSPKPPAATLEELMAFLGVWLTGESSG